MKKQISIISAVVTTALIAGLTAIPVFAETQEKDEAAAGIQVYTGFSFQQEWSEEAGRALAQSVCPRAALDDETAAAWPELEKAFAALNEEKKKDADETYQTTLADAKERLLEDPEYPTTFTDSESFCVVRADSRIVSLLSVYNGYTGGAHGYEGFSGVNIDPASGKTLALSDVVTDSAAFTALVKEELLRLYPDVDKDLTDRYEKDAEIDKSDFMQNVIDAFKTDGRMYMIVPGFTVTGVAGKAKYIGDGSDLTIKKAVDIASKMGLNETGVFGMMDCESVLSYAIEFSGDQFIDMDSHTCDFNNDRFRELLEFAKKFPQQIEEDESVDYSTQYLADKALLGIQFINTPFDYYYMTRQLYGDIDMTVTGFPSENNKGPAVAPSAEIGISSSTSDPDGCWQFVRRFLMEEYQSSLDSCLPISKKAIKAQGQAVIDSFEEQNAELEEELNAQGMEVYNETGSEDAAEAPTGDEITEVTDDVDSSETESEDMTGKPIPEKDFDGTHEEYEKYVKEFKEDMKKAESDTTAEEVIVAPEEIDAGDTAQAYGLDSLPEFGQADLDKMQKILDNLSFSVNSENDVLNIILEEAGAYFAGQKSTEEVSDIIQSRIQVYLKENE